MKMELTEGSETSAYINRTPGNYPKGNLLYDKLRLASRNPGMCLLIVSSVALNVLFDDTVS